MKNFELAGWVIGESLFSVPYDWRLPAFAQSDEFFSNFTTLVERAYTSNGNRKVVLMGASFGPQFVLSFLHRQSQAWKDQYIEVWKVLLSLK